MIITFKLKREGEACASLLFVENLQARVTGGLIEGIVFSKRELTVILEKERVLCAYMVDTSLPPVYLAGWLLFAFFLFMGFSWVWWIVPAVFGCTGLFYWRVWFEFMLRLSFRKAKVTGAILSAEEFIREVHFEHGAD